MYLLIVREKDKEGAPAEILDVKIVPAKDLDRYAQRTADKKVRAPFRLTRGGEAAGTHLPNWRLYYMTIQASCQEQKSDVPLVLNSQLSIR